MPQPAKTDRSLLISILLVTAVARLAVYLVTGYQVDDALITFRYAENLAAGNGFVYNVGEHILGTTSPLFTVLLASLKYLGVAVPHAAMAVSNLFALLTSYCLLRFAERCGLSRLSFLPALIYALYPRSIVSDICGLETAVFTSMLVVAFYLLFSRRYFAAVIAASLACLTRPEGAALLLIVLGVAAYERAPRFWLVAAAPLTLVGGWSIFSIEYFGTIIPNSTTAKSALYANSTPLINRLGQMTTLGTWPGLVLIAAVIAVAFVLAKQRDRLSVVALTALGMVFGLSLFSPRIFFWYAAPALPLLFLVLTKGFDLIAGKRLSEKLSLGLAVVFALCLAVVSFTRIDGLESEMQWYADNHIAAAEYLNAHAATGDTVLAEDIGHFGYHYRGRIIDRDGLVTPQAIDYNRSGSTLQFADSVNANWLFLAINQSGLLPILNSAAFMSRYELITLARPRTLETHRLYQRR